MHIESGGVVVGCEVSTSTPNQFGKSARYSFPERQANTLLHNAVLWSNFVSYTVSCEQVERVSEYT